MYVFATLRFVMVLGGVIGAGRLFRAVPCGTGNDFAKSSRLPSDPIEALKKQRTGYLRKIYAGNEDASRTYAARALTWMCCGIRRTSKSTLRTSSHIFGAPSVRPFGRTHHTPTRARFTPRRVLPAPFFREPFQNSGKRPRPCPERACSDIRDRSASDPPRGWSCSPFPLRSTAFLPS